MKLIVQLINRIAQLLLIVIFSVLVCCVVWQVVSRYVVGSPSIVTDEVARFLFMWAGLIGAAYATGLKQHIAIDLLLSKQTGKKKTYLEVFILLVMGFFAGFILIYGGGELAWHTHLSGQISPTLGLDMGLIYLSLPVAGILMLVFILDDLIQKIRQFVGQEKA